MNGTTLGKKDCRTGRASALVFLVPFCFCLLAAGCRSTDRIERELHARERELQEARDELHRSEYWNHALQREVQDLRQNRSAKMTPEQAAQVCSLKEIVLGRQTGGCDDDRCPGDEALQVVLEPRDPDGHAIKAPGTLHVAALEISPEGLKTPLCSWQVPPDQLRRSWRSGLLSTGYYVVLPWRNWPSGEKLRVVARFTLTDGRVFEAEKDVTIRGTPAQYRKPTPVPETREPILPGPEVPLPPPRKLDPAGVSGPSSKSLPLLPKSPRIEPAAMWQKAPPAPLSSAVQLLRPIPIGDPKLQMRRGP